ncbi:hypothetical protein ACFFRR_000127 [Megaselia abdita]
MRSLVIGLFVIGVAFAISPSTEYLPPSNFAVPSRDYLPPTSFAAQASFPRFAAPTVQRNNFVAPSSEYLPPTSVAASNSHVSFAPAQASFPRFAAPTVQRNNFVAPSSEYLPPTFASDPAPAHSLASDGYHYKRARRYRHKRDTPINEYLPPQATEQHETYVASPSKQSNTIIAPPGVSAKATLEDRIVTSKGDSYAAPPSGASQEIAAAASSPAGHSLESDGYHYRTVKRYRLRRY